MNEQIFRAYDVRGKYPEEINEDVAFKIGQALVHFLKADRLAVGRDVRESSMSLMTAFVNGVTSQGCDVHDFGILPTPALYFAVQAKILDGGAIITASHNARGFNGIKLVNRDFTAIGVESGIQDIKDMVVQGKIPQPRTRSGFEKQDDIALEYSEHVLGYIDQSKINPFHLVLDASGGSAGRIISYVFQDIKNVQTVKMNFWPKDIYPDHALNPLLIDSQKAIKKQIKKIEKTEGDIPLFGAIWDGDGDRCLLVDEQGQLVEPYHLCCLLIKILLEKEHASVMWHSPESVGPPSGENSDKNLIYYEPRLIRGIMGTIQKYGGQGKMIKAGRAYFEIEMNKAGDQYEAGQSTLKPIIGCESSGHYILGRQRLFLTDGILPLLIVMEYLSTTNLLLSGAVEEFRQKYFISGEINFPVKNETYKQRIIDILSGKYAEGQKNTLDGLSVDYPDWRFNIRPSNTENLLRLNIEGVSQKLVDQKTKEVLRFIKKIK